MSTNRAPDPQRGRHARSPRTSRPASCTACPVWHRAPEAPGSVPWSHSPRMPRDPQAGRSVSQGVLRIPRARGRRCCTAGCDRLPSDRARSRLPREAAVEMYVCSSARVWSRRGRDRHPTQSYAWRLNRLLMLDGVAIPTPGSNRGAARSRCRRTWISGRQADARQSSAWSSSRRVSRPIRSRLRLASTVIQAACVVSVTLGRRVNGWSAGSGSTW